MAQQLSMGGQGMDGTVSTQTSNHNNMVRILAFSDKKNIFFFNRNKYYTALQNSVHGA